VKLPTVSGGTGPRFLRHIGIAAPLLVPDVRIDDIAPMLPSSIPGLSSGQRAFETLRYLPDGSENPDFVLNQDPYRSASILLAGDNFGTGGGSAVEAAVTRLLAFGFRAVLAPGFGPVFLGKSVSLGMVPVTLEEAATEEIAAQVVANPGMEVTVDLEEQVVGCHGAEPEAIAFTIDARARNKLLLGLRDLEEMLQHRDKTRELRIQDRNMRPWLYGRGE